MIFPSDDVNFNSRAHVERDKIQKRRKVSWLKFQLTRSRGARLSLQTTKNAKGQFQLTRSRGARLAVGSPGYMIFPFQLTRSRGARRPNDSAPCSLPSFQLTRSRGARPPHGRTMRRTTKFQLTRSRGARLKDFLGFSEPKNFNSRAHVERDGVILVVVMSAQPFQLTRSRGARPVGH